jgi:20S proteasome alpha/beta subunit
LEILENEEFGENPLDFKQVEENSNDDPIFFAASGCLADTLGLQKILTKNARSYKWQSGGERSLSVESTAFLLSSVLYTRRGFPFYSFSVLAGLCSPSGSTQGFRNRSHSHPSVGGALGDNGAKMSHGGALYRYDAVGSFERTAAVCAGPAEQLIQPMLDRLVEGVEGAAAEDLMDIRAEVNSSTDQNSNPAAGAAAAVNADTETDTGLREAHSFDKAKTRPSHLWQIEPAMQVFEEEDPNAHVCKGLSAAKAVRLVLRAFQAAAEREISVGDGLDVVLMRRRGGGAGTSILSFHFHLPKH